MYSAPPPASQETPQVWRLLLQPSYDNRLFRQLALAGCMPLLPLPRQSGVAKAKLGAKHLPQQLVQQCAAFCCRHSAASNKHLQLASVQSSLQETLSYKHGCDLIA